MAAASSALYRTLATEQVWSLMDRLPDPDLVLRLNGMSRKDLKKLVYDDEIGGAMDTHRDAVASTPWRLDPYTEKEHLWLWETIEQHADDVILGAWDAIPYGYSVLETVLKPGPVVTIDSVRRKPMQWFEPRRDGTLWMNTPGAGQWVQVPTDGKFLLTVRLGDYENPFGQAVLSRCFWPWFFRQNGWEFWMKFLERFADALLLGKVQVPENFVSAMNALGFANVIGVGKDEEVTAVTSSGQSEFKAVEDALAMRIQKTWLGQTLTTQMSASGGSFAAANVHNLVRMDKKQSALRLIQPTCQRLVDLLWRVNGKVGKAPRFILADPQGLEEDRANRDKMLADANIVKFTAKYVTSHYDLEEDEFEVPVEQVSTDPPIKQMTAGQAAQFAPRIGQRFSADQELVELLLAESLKEAAEPIPSSAIIDVVRLATDKDDLLRRLAKLYGGHNPVKFQELFERSLFAADVLGYVTAQKRIGAKDIS